MDLFIEVSNNTSVTSTTWFWPLLSVSLALLLSIPCTLITVIVLCHKKNQLNDSDESSIDHSVSSSSSSSSSSTPVQRQSIHHHHHHHHHRRLQRSHYVGAIRSPPPPYTTSERPETVFVTSSLPPPYESHITENASGPATLANPPTTVINVEPLDTTINQSSIIQPVETTLDVSSTVNSPSIQTFHV